MNRSNPVLRTARVALACLAGVWLSLGVAHGTIARALSLKQMAQDADVIVRGVVLDRTASWNAEKTRIYTVTILRIEDALKGSSKGKTLKIRQLGGTADGLSQRIIGNANFTKGEEVVVFLRRDPERDLHYVIGMAQGKFRVDRSGPAPRITHSLKGLALAKVEDGHLARVVRPKTSGTQTEPSLEAFTAQVQRALRQ